MAVPGGDGLVAHGLQGPDGGELGLGAAHPEARDLAALRHLQGVAEDGGPVQLLHKGLRELLKGVAEDDGLGLLAQGIQEVLGARQGIDPGDGRLDLPQAQAALFQDAQAPAHQLVVIRLVPGGALELRDAALLGEGDPDLGHQDTLHIKADNVHSIGPFSRGRKKLPRVS